MSSGGPPPLATPYSNISMIMILQECNPVILNKNPAIAYFSTNPQLHTTAKALFTLLSNYPKPPPADETPLHDAITHFNDAYKAAPADINTTFQKLIVDGLIKKSAP